MSGIPQTIGLDISKGINELIRSSDRFRDWNSPEILALRDDCDKLQKIEAARAFIHRGALAAICGEVEQIFTFFKKALDHPDPVTTKFEFWTSLSNVGMYKSAAELGSWLLVPRRGKFLQVWERAISLGYLRETAVGLIEAQKMFREELASVDFSLLNNSLKVMDERSLQDADIISVFDLMGEVQRAHRIMFAGDFFVTKFRVMRPPEDLPYLFFSLPIDAGVEEVHQMNRELLKLVVERLPGGAFPGGIVTSFAKAVRNIELPAAA